MPFIMYDHDLDGLMACRYSKNMYEMYGGEGKRVSK